MMNYENILTVLISLSALLTAIMGALLAWRYRASNEQALGKMLEYFEADTETVSRQTASLLQEGKSLENALSNPESLDQKALERLSVLASEIAQSLNQSLSNKKEFEKLAVQDYDTKEAYEKNIAASKEALESVERWRASLATLLELARKRQGAHG
jgi:uncharacterized protein YoxC